MKPIEIAYFIFVALCIGILFTAPPKKQKPIEYKSSPKVVRYHRACTLNVIRKLKNNWTSSDNDHQIFWKSMKRCEV